MYPTIYSWLYFNMQKLEQHVMTYCLMTGDNCKTESVMRSVSSGIFSQYAEYVNGRLVCVDARTTELE